MIIRVQWLLSVENTGGGQKTWGGTGKCAGGGPPMGIGKIFWKIFGQNPAFWPIKELRKRSSVPDGSL